MTNTKSILLALAWLIGARGEEGWRQGVFCAHL
jgi:hypothetical protein